MSLSRFCKENNISNPKLDKVLTLDLTGHQFGHLKVIEPVQARSHCGCIVWRCQCLAEGCGKIVERASNTLRHGMKRDQSCGCYITIKNFRGKGQLSKSYLSSLRMGAKARNLPFEIDVDYAWELFEKQKGLCALSGVNITLHRNYRTVMRRSGERQTASLDRIDSTKGYVKGNVQWIHRRLNPMKSNTPNQEFIDWCRKIALWDDSKGGLIFNPTLPAPKIWQTKP